MIYKSRKTITIFQGYNFETKFFYSNYVDTDSFYFEIFWAQVNFSDLIGMMSADIFKRKMALAIQLNWIFLALKWAVFCL